MSDEESVECGARDHADDGQPDVGHALGGVASVPYRQHMRQGLEQGPRVLLYHRSILHGQTSITISRVGKAVANHAEVRGSIPIVNVGKEPDDEIFAPMPEVSVYRRTARKI